MYTSILLQTAIIFALYFMGEGIATLLPITIPGNIIGMLLMFIGLLLKWIKVKHVQTVGRFFLSHMAFLFIPAGVSIIESIELIQDDWFKILIVCVLTTIITFAATGLTAKAVIRLQEGWKRKK